MTAGPWRGPLAYTRLATPVFGAAIVNEVAELATPLPDTVMPYVPGSRPVGSLTVAAHLPAVLTVTVSVFAAVFAPFFLIAIESFVATAEVPLSATVPTSLLAT